MQRRFVFAWIWCVFCSAAQNAALPAFKGLIYINTQSTVAKMLQLDQSRKLIFPELFCKKMWEHFISSVRGCGFCPPTPLQQWCCWFLWDETQHLRYDQINYLSRTRHRYWITFIKALLYEEWWCSRWRGVRRRNKANQANFVAYFVPWGGDSRHCARRVAAIWDQRHGLASETARFYAIDQRFSTLLTVRRHLFAFFWCCFSQRDYVAPV